MGCLIGCLGCFDFVDLVCGVSCIECVLLCVDECLVGYEWWIDFVDYF